MTDFDRKNTIGNLVAHMSNVNKKRRDIAERGIKNFYKADPEFGDGIAKAMGFPAIKSRLWLSSQPYPSTILY